MANVPARLLLFLSSYAPLFLIIALRGRRDNSYVATLLSALAITSVVVLFAYVRTVERLAAQRLAVASVISRYGDAASYIVTYLLPFLPVKLSDLLDITSLGVVLLVIGLLYVNSNMIYTNPVLNIVGYRFPRLAS